METKVRCDCPWSDTCGCANTRCVAGWIEKELTDEVAPCPTCRPEVAVILRDVWDRTQAYKALRARSALPRRRGSREPEPSPAKV